MTCKDCNTRNPIGNKFCRECGTKLPLPADTLAREEIARAEAERAAERAGILLSEAFTLSERGKPEAALPLAEEAAALLPRSTAAHGLLAALYERTGQLESALAEMERVVTMNPDSAADADKLERLRKRLGIAENAEAEDKEEADTLTAKSEAEAEASEGTTERVAVPKTTVPRKEPATPQRPAPAAPRRPTQAQPAGSSWLSWLPIAAAGGVGALVLGVGMGVMRANANRQPDPIGSPQAASAPDVRVAPAPMTGSTTGFQLPAQRDFTPPATTRNDPFSPVDGARRSAEQAANSASVVAAPAPNSKTDSLPSLLKNLGTQRQQRSSSSTTTNTARATIAPAAVPDEIVAAARRNGTGLPALGGPAENNGFGSGERIAAAPPSSGQETATTFSAAPPSSNSNGGGYIKITVSPPAGGGGSSRNSPILATPPGASENNGDGDPMQRAQKLQGAGRYGDAARAYEDAISTGADTGEAHQGMGLARQRGGDKEGARAAYRQAIAAYEAQIAAGRNVAAARRGIESCKAALEVLGGD